MLFRYAENDRISFWCPGCDSAHTIGIGPSGWQWDEASLTVSPSIKVQGVQWAPESSFHRLNHHVAPGSPICCHSFIRNGVWEFLDDCTHQLVGQTAPLHEWPLGGADATDPR